MLKGDDHSTAPMSLHMDLYYIQVMHKTDMKNKALEPVFS
jgi:hypothetical protein